MIIVMGGTGHVGAAAARMVLAQGQPVTIVTRDATEAEVPEGAMVAEADATDPHRLRAIFRTGRRAFLLNPPGPIDGDFDAGEMRTIDAILSALDGSGLEKVVAASTYGARAGRCTGDLGTLHHFEEGLRAQPIPAAIQRGAYYMSNWDIQLDRARATGRISSVFPADLAIPMVAPADLGAAAARWLLEPADRVGLRFVEGPARYSARDAARAFADALGRKVEVDVVPPDRWVATYRELGFSAEAAESFAGMARVSLQDTEFPHDPVRGPMTLDTYIRALVLSAAAPADRRRRPTGG